MARDYQIKVTGVAFAVREIGAIERSLRRQLRIATDEAVEIVETTAQKLAPEPDEHTVEKHGDWQGKGVFADSSFEPNRRMAGRAPRAAGGGFMIELDWEIALGVTEETVAAYVELGTGLYRDPEFGGPHTEFIIEPTQDHGLLGPMIDKKEMGKPDFISIPGDSDPLFMVRGPVTHPGGRPRPFLSEVEAYTQDAIEKLYDHAVAKAVRRG